MPKPTTGFFKTREELIEAARKLLATPGIEVSKAHRKLGIGDDTLAKLRKKYNITIGK